ncbi:MAG: transposase [Bacteroidota bacterium]
MADQRRKFSNVEKQFILTQANKQGVSKVLREYKLSYSVYTRWKQQFLTSESENKNDLLQSRVEELRKENIRLKNIIANLVVDLEIKSEELKSIQLQGGTDKH